MDVGEVGADVLTPDEIDRVVQDHPRLGFQEKFRDLVVDHAARRPDCHLFTRAGWVATEHAQNTCAFDEYGGAGRVWIVPVCRHQQSETAQAFSSWKTGPDLRGEKFPYRGQENQVFEVAF